MTGRSSGLPVEKKSPRFQLRDKLVRAQCVSLSQDHFAQRMSFREVREDEVLEGPNRDEPDLRTARGHGPPSVEGFTTRPVSAARGFRRGSSPGCKTRSPRQTDHSARARPRAWDRLRSPRSCMSRTSSSRIPSVVTPATRTNPGLNRPVGVLVASSVRPSAEPQSLRGRSG